MTYKDYKREECYVNLLELRSKSGAISRIQNFLPSEKVPFYSLNGVRYFFFPFRISSFSSGIDLDAVRSEIRIPNLDNASDFQGYITFRDFNKSLEGSRVRIIYLFLDPQTNDPANGDIYAPRGFNIERRFTINSVSQNSGVVILSLRNPLNAVDQTFPRRHFSGNQFRELPIDNSPRFTSGTSYY